MLCLEIDEVEECELHLGAEDGCGQVCVAFGDDNYFCEYADWLDPVVYDLEKLGIAPISDVLEDDLSIDVWNVQDDETYTTYLLAWAHKSLEETIDKEADAVYLKLFKKLKIGVSNEHLGGKLLYAALGDEHRLMHRNISAYMKRHKTFTVENLEELLDYECGLHRIKTSAGEIVLCWSSDVPDKDLKFPVPPPSPLKNTGNSIFDDDR